MGDSGAAGSNSTRSGSDSDGGSFEFGNVEEASEAAEEAREDAGEEREAETAETEDDLSEAVDFSLEMDGVDFGSEAEQEDSEDPADPADEPDGETTEPSVTASSSGSPSDADTEQSTSGQEEQTPEGDTADAADGSDEEEGSAFYDIDPVDDSQSAFNFAENQSKAAYEFAYEGATQNPVARFFTKYLSHTVRKRLDEVFSRKMLGSVLVGGAFSKMIEACVGFWLGTSGHLRIAAWIVIFVVATMVFVWWDHLSRKASEAAEQATEAASEAAESASQKAEAASEAASQAAESATGGDEEQASAGTGGQAPTELDGAGQTAGSHGTGGNRRAPARRRAPDRRSNRRFEPESTTQEQLSAYENGDAFEQVEIEELPQQGGGFENAGDNTDHER